MFIQIEKNPDGSHASQYGGELQEGWAHWDTDAVPLPESFPWVDIVVEDVTHPEIKDEENGKVLQEEYTQLEVVSATACEIPEEDDSGYTAPPSNDELAEENKRLKAQMEMQAQNITFLENCLLEMGDIVYA